MVQQQAASVGLVRNGRVLLIQRARAPYAGLWTLPGGRVEPGETSEEAAARELMEELGITVGQLGPVTSIASGGWSLDTFASATFDGNIVPSDEIADWRWCDVTEAQALPTTPGLLDVIRLCLQRTGSPA